MTDPDELERLRRENQQLHEQVKLLVRTEQRLYRSQGQLDDQLRRIEGLGAFALECMHATEAGQVLSSAAHLLDTVYGLRRVVALYLEAQRVLVSTELIPQSTGAPRIMDAEHGGSVREFLQQLDDPMILTDDMASGWTLLESLDCGDCEPLLLPLREEPNATSGLLVCIPARGSFFRSTPGAEDLPFLRLMCLHLERALTNVRIANHLTLQNRRLLESIDEMSKMEAVGRLAGGVAHDFNNLLTVITTSAQMLAEEPQDSTDWAQDIEEILAASRRAAKLVAQLLTFSRQHPPQLSQVDLNQLVTGLGRMLRRLLRADIDLELKLDPGLDPIRADPSQLEQVVVNLVINARDATGPNGVITLETRSIQNAARLTVRDTGHGMDEQTRVRVFEPFFTTKAVGEGTGMGLATVYGIVSQHDGTIAVHSQPGRGTEFILLFPASDDPTSVTPSPADRRPVEFVGHGRTVLVVEDEPRIRRVLRRVLTQHGCDVITASDGEDAVRVATERGGEIDLVVTDLVMPNIDGIQLAQQLRQTWPALRFLFMSGYPGDRLSQYGLDLDSVDYLAKPFTKETLVERVARALG